MVATSSSFSYSSSRGSWIVASNNEIMPVAEENVQRYLSICEVIFVAFVTLVGEAS
jgi:hypothetical protein